jgi:glutathione synthase/RimK-type ligase-like ATP-grasp enzyme
MKLKVTYDKNLKIGAVGPSVWAKLGPEEWFQNYKIVCADARDYDEPFVVDLHMVDPSAANKLTTQAVVNLKEFQEIVQTQLNDYRFIVYSPVNVPDGLLQQTFIANHISFRRFENKCEFRKLFSEEIPIPQYFVVSMDELFEADPVQFFDACAQKLMLPFVLQDEASGGGCGTFIIRSVKELVDAIAVLKQEKKGDACVVSKFIRGVERSVQVFVSASNTIIGPLQQQLVRNPELLNQQGRGDMFFCGGRIVTDASEKVKQQVHEIVTKTSEVMKKAGYKGIYGIDFLVDDNQNVYVLEINARTTGLLPLLNEQHTDLPLYLLHILELANERYAVDTSPSIAPSQSAPQSFVVLFNQADENVRFRDAIQTGNYRLTDTSLERLDTKARWNPDADVMLQLFCSSEFPSKPNFKMCNIFLKNSGFDDYGNLTEQASRIVALVKHHTIPFGKKA